MHIFIKLAGRKIKGKREIKLLKHIFTLCWHSLPPPLTFSKNFLARYARSIAFYSPIRNASMLRDFATQIIFSFLVFLVLLSLTASLQNAPKHVKSHIIAYKTSIKGWRLELTTLRRLPIRLEIG